MPPWVAIMPSAPPSGISMSAVSVHDLFSMRGDGLGRQPDLPG